MIFQRIWILITFWVALLFTIENSIHLPCPKINELLASPLLQNPPNALSGQLATSSEERVSQMAQRYLIDELSFIISFNDPQIIGRSLDLLQIEDTSPEGTDLLAPLIKKIRHAIAWQYSQGHEKSPVTAMVIQFNQSGEARLLIESTHSVKEPVLRMIESMCQSLTGSCSFLNKEEKPLQSPLLFYQNFSLLDDLITPPIIPHQPPIPSASTHSKADYQFDCHQDHDWWICDYSQGTLQTAKNIRLPTDIKYGSIWGYIPKVNLDSPLSVSPFDELVFVLQEGLDGLRLVVDFQTNRSPFFGLLRPRPSITDSINFVDPATPLYAKLSLRFDEILLYPQLLDHLPILNALSKWSQKGWNGELSLTFDGNFNHPIFLIGLAPHPWSGEQLLASIKRILNATLSHYDTIDRPLKFSFSFREKIIELYVAESGQHLVIGLNESDVQRRIDSTLPPRPLITAPLERLGISGVILDPLFVMDPDLSESVRSILQTTGVSEWLSKSPLLMGFNQLISTLNLEEKQILQAHFLRISELLLITFQTLSNRTHSTLRVECLWSTL